MPSDKGSFNFRQFIDRILEPAPSIKGTNLRLHAYLTALFSLVLAVGFLLAAVVLLLLGQTAIMFSLLVMAAILGVAYYLVKFVNAYIGSIILIGGTILAGILVSTSIPNNTTEIMVLMIFIVPAFTFGILVLRLRELIIVAISAVVLVGLLPLMQVMASGPSILLRVGLAIIGAFFILIARYHQLTEDRQEEEIHRLTSRLAERVEERTRFARLAAEISQEIIASATLEEVLNETVNQITSRFGFAFTAVYLTDETEQYIDLKAAQGTEADTLLRQGRRLSFGPPSMLGWVAREKQQRLATTALEDPLELQVDLVAGCESEIAIPIVSSKHLLGVLDIQSSGLTTFDNEIIVVLEMLSNQVATALQNIRHFNVERGGVQKASKIFLAGNKIIQAKSESEVYQTLDELFTGSSFLAMFLVPHGDSMHAIARTSVFLPDGQKLPELLAVPMEEVEPYVRKETFVGEGARLNSLPYNLVRFCHQAGIFSIGLIPVAFEGKVSAVLLYGTQERTPLQMDVLEPYVTLANQVSSSVDRIREIMREQEKTNETLAVANLASSFATAHSEAEVTAAIRFLFQTTDNSVIFLQAEGNQFRITGSADFTNAGQPLVLPDKLAIAPSGILSFLGERVFVGDVERFLGLFSPASIPEGAPFQQAADITRLSAQLGRFIETVRFKTIALLPVLRGGDLAELLILGKTTTGPIKPSLEALNNITGHLTHTVNRIRDEQELERRLNEDEVIISLDKEINSISELSNLYQTLHNYVRKTIGGVNFLVALYEANTNSISIPYMYETGEDGAENVVKVEAFPLGEGLTSILIRTKKPLMIVEDTEHRAAALGAKVIGKTARSWLGTPIIIADQVVGALVIQDLEHEFAFTDNDLRFLSSLSDRVAAAIYNARLLEETRHGAIQLQTAAEIARDISGSLDLGELLNRAVTLICERFNFYHASVFLIDKLNEYAVIREATGDAGTQMKRAGHKLKVGSKSIVGTVTSTGEPMVVNDTSRDATYFANPLLPETRAEVAIPLKTGQRIVGALDVQSSQPFSFTKEDISVLRILADQMAIAVINSELFADTQENLSKSRLLHHVTTTAASGNTLDETLDGAVQGLQATMGGDRVSILLSDRQKNVLTIKSYAGYSEDIRNLVLPIGQGITGWVAEHAQTLRVDDVVGDPRYVKAADNIHSELAVPLLYRGELLGVLNVESDKVAHFNENDEELLGTLGGSLAAVISNARLIEQVRRQVDRERLLYEVTNKIRRSTDLQTIVTSTATELNKVLGARRTQIKVGTLKLEPAAGQAGGDGAGSEGGSK